MKLHWYNPNRYRAREKWWMWTNLAERWKRIVRLKREAQSRDVSFSRKRGRRRAFYSILGGQDEICSNLLNRNWFSTRTRASEFNARLKWYATSFMIPWWGAVWVWYQMAADDRTSHEAKRGFRIVILNVAAEWEQRWHRVGVYRKRADASRYQCRHIYHTDRYGIFR